MFDDNKQALPISGNAIVGQSGGPTAAINATLSGVIKGLRKCENIKRVYGMKNGIEGLINGNVVDLASAVTTEEDYYALECTPAAALGSCRKKLPSDLNDPIYPKIFEIFRQYDIRYVLYIGGNDSMDTASKLSAYAKEANYEIYVMGVPKTIDNDLVVTDHTPGFGSAIKYIATTVEEIARDCSIYAVQAVTIVEIMGRDAGWLAAGAALPRLSGQACADLVYVAETEFDFDEFIEDVKKELEKKPNVVIAVSEGIKTKDGKYVGESEQSGSVDIFGHKYLAGAARVLESCIRAKIGCKCRSIEMSLPQRCAGHCLSKTDIEESVLVGASCAKHVAAGNSGDFAFFIRDNNADGSYSVSVGFCPVSRIANQIKRIPAEYINERGNNVTDELLHYLQPLILGEVQIPMKNGLPVHFTID
ncbi:MAG: diphosphate--fructose-6-phosphate 1-phosphotransferase [Ruminococcaceae bacterium]|nr:diphosphate--fructose-6-phosphate 1-phosphotransferase [Oscillospiraceae bacterium]